MIDLVQVAHATCTIGVLAHKVVARHAVIPHAAIMVEPRKRLVVLTVVTLLAACGAEGRSRDDDPSATSFGSIGSLSGSHSDPESTADSGGKDSGAGHDFDLGGAPEGTTPDECAAVVEQADVGFAGADIIIVIDNSQSMSNEIAGVQAEMNAFSAQIIAADVDAHVVMVSGFEHNSDSGICVPPPLGSGLCPQADDNPPLYWRIGQWVGSHSALARVVDYYPVYSPALRSDASTHVVVVSDDDSDWTAEQFTADFTALNPKLGGFTLHAIVNGSGAVYQAIASQTGGIVGNLAAGEFQPIFDELASLVVEQATLACSFEIPPAPDGQTFDPSEVNVEFADGAGGTLGIGYVEDAAQCGAVVNGWHYDDPEQPTTIVLCPQTCTEIQGYALATISLAFGCATIPAG